MAESTAFPWLKHLPEDEQTEFYVELEQALADAIFDVCPGVAPKAEDFINRVDPVIASWKSTAEVHADSELKAALTRVAEGFTEDDFEEAEGDRFREAVPQIVWRWIGSCSCKGQDLDCAKKDENWERINGE